MSGTNKGGRRVGALMACCALVALATGCASYNKKSDAFVAAFQDGRFPEAADSVTKMTGTIDAPGKTFDQQTRPDRKDAMLFRMEQGAVYRYAGEFERSNLAFQHSLELIESFDQDAKIKLGQEGAALVTNMTALDYRGQMYDRVMVSTYRALNYLETGQNDKARPEILAAYARQQDAVARYADQIAKEQEKAIKTARNSRGNSGAQADVDRTLNNPQTSASLSQNFAWVDQMAAYTDYVNPFSEYLQGLYFTYAAIDAADRERGRKSFEKVAALLPRNTVLPGDLTIATAIAQGAAPRPTTYILFETGLAAQRREIRIDLPIFLVNIVAYDTGVDYVGVAFPVLKRTDDYVAYLGIDTSVGTVQTQLLADMDGVVAREFKNELPSIITKTIAAAATKAAIAYGANKATEGTNNYVNLLTRVGTTIYQVAANQADLRTWRTLPKQFQVARIDTPPDRQLRLRLPNGSSLPTYTLGQGQVNVVYVRSTSTRAPVVVRSFALR